MLELADRVQLGDIPADFTRSAWGLQYHFELPRGSDAAWLHPGVNVQTWAPPYFVVRQRRS